MIDQLPISMIRFISFHLVSLPGSFHLAATASCTTWLFIGLFNHTDPTQLITMVSSSWASALVCIY